MNLLQSKKQKHDRITEDYYSYAAQLASKLVTPVASELYVTVHGLEIFVDEPEVCHLLREYEIAYAQLGYRIIPLRAWIDSEGWGVSIEHLWLIKRASEERPIYTRFTDVPEIPKRNLLGGD